MPFNLTSNQKQTITWLSVALAFILLLSLLGPILMPFIVAAILAYVLNPWLDKLCKLRIKGFHMPRPIAATLMILLVVACILAIVLIMVPILQKQIPLLHNQIPQFLDRFNTMLGPILRDFGIQANIDSEGIKAIISDHLASSGDVIGKAVLSSIRVGGTAVLGMLANFILIPIVLFYLLVDWHALIGRLRNFIPRRWLKQTQTWFKEVDELLAQYLRGQIMVMVILAIYYSLGLAIAGFDLALPVGILTGLLVFIPYLGYGLGLFLALVSAVLQFNDLHGLVAVGIVYGIGQALESFILTPKLVGERIGLHPLTVIFALMAFGQLFGFIGILVALPASAVISVAAKNLRLSYLNSSFYRQS
ncbi:AI-2E family transporter [Undibacterium flavidum]|uniref:AI-2E family transporter n=1 Tax=Undibacterium flavidum TaxID=2762297 RepID=A0ABR6Y6I4_9BURK|nr:AI-2E family transporter [Undibacterium flavidum]MBC3872230.1 AI-2E family transporter [Undibacterium flavidum]